MKQSILNLAKCPAEALGVRLLFKAMRLWEFGDAGPRLGLRADLLKGLP